MSVDEGQRVCEFAFKIITVSLDVRIVNVFFFIFTVIVKCF